MSEAQEWVFCYWELPRLHGVALLLRILETFYEKQEDKKRVEEVDRTRKVARRISEFFGMEPVS
jgi:hypothetical protein